MCYLRSGGRSMDISPLSSSEAIALENQYGARNYHPLPVVLSRGEGVYLYSPEGKRYFDFLAGYSAVNQGHCHPRLVKALIDQAQTLTLTSRAFYNNWLGRAEQRICSFFGYQKALFMNSGAEANETAIKMVRKWGYERKKIPADQAVILCASGNFHGRTLGVISASTDPSSRAGFGPYLPGYRVLPYGDGSAALEALKDPKVAGFWIEPIQGEAGVVFPPEGYLKQVSEACRARQVAFMADEIQTGIGRAGWKTACEREGVRPDVLILGKSLSGGLMPISAVLADDEWMSVFRPGEHGSTFGGNPLASRIVIEALDVVEQEKLCERSREMGELFRQELEPLKTHPWVREIRGVGLMSALEMRSDAPQTAWQVCLKLMERGLLAKPTHDTTIRLTPPLVISSQQVREAASIIRAVFS